MSRRGNGEGSISRRPEGRWQAQITVEGKRRSAYGRTREDAAAKLQALQAGASAGLPAVDQRATVSSYLTRWLEQVTPRLRPTTVTRYRGLVTGQIIPTLGRHRLRELAPSDVARMMALVQGDGLSARTAGHCRAVLRAALSDAERDGLVSRNVARLADPIHLPPPAPTVLSPAEVWAVLDAMPDPGLHRLVSVAVTTGLRLGEQLGLTWGDIDFEGRRLHVRTALQRLGGAYSLTEPKSASSRRTVALPAAALEALTEERRWQGEARLAAGGRWHEPIRGLVFTTSTGAPRNGTALTHMLQAELERAGLPRLRWHDLRAAHGSLLLAGGTDISVVSRRLGHSSVSLTSRHYGGVADALQHAAADRLGQLLQRPG